MIQSCAMAGLKISSGVLQWSFPKPYVFANNCNRSDRKRLFCIDPKRNDLVVASTQRWIERVVIGEKLCPFASPLVASNTLRVVASSAILSNEAVSDVRAEVNLLLSEKDERHSKNTILPHPESTLVVFDSSFVQNFRDFVHLSWTLQEEVVVRGGFQDEIQLVLFHPKATHQTYSDHSCETNDDNSLTTATGDFTIRSPFPTVHLLREKDVMQAVQKSNYQNLTDLSTRNKQKLFAQGIAVCRARLDACYVTHLTPGHTI